MFFRTLTRSGALLLVAAGLSAPALAQKDERPSSGFSSLVNIDALMDNYLRFLARKYDLTEEQDLFTQGFVRAKVDAFLDRHRDELQDLVDQLFAVRTGGEMSEEELVEWGRRVLPIYEEAKVIILGANAEWREILTDEQRVIHDADLKLMHESFATTESQLQRMLTGQMTVEEFRNPQRFGRSRAGAESRTGLARPKAGSAQMSRGEDSSGMRRSPGRPSPSSALERSPQPTRRRGRSSGASAGYKPGEERTGRLSRSPSGLIGKADQGFESRWEAYVREFIERFQLTPEQQDRARKILKSCQQRGAKYMRTRRAEIEKLDRQAEELKAGTDKDKGKALADISAKRSRLLAPIENIFERQLKPRLEKLPTRAQREAAAKAPPKATGRPRGRETPEESEEQKSDGDED